MGDLTPRGCPPRAPCGEPGCRETRVVGVGRGRGAGAGPAGIWRLSLTWRGAEHPAPPRGPRCVIRRVSGARPVAAGWSRGRWRAGDRAAHPARWPRRPPLFLPRPTDPPRPIYTSSLGRWGYLREFPLGGLPRDPIWPLKGGIFQVFQMVCRGRKFFRLPQDSLRSACSFLRKFPGQAGHSVILKAVCTQQHLLCSATTASCFSSFPFSVAVGTR